MNIYKNISKEDFKKLCNRPVFEEKDLTNLMRDIFEAVEKKGDAALKEFTQKFDKVNLKNLKVSASELEEAAEKVPEDLSRAIKLAYENIAKFHSTQQTKKQIIETQKGVECWQESRPIERIGIYIPGGTAPLFSTVLMLAAPAKIAACREIILCTPPDKNGNVHPTILYAAKLTGVTQIFKVGGAQAIAGLSIGTDSIPKVYKIFGPGNQYVTAAKTYAQRLGTAIDMPAGPSELLVLADDTAKPAFIAADLLSQAEHGVDSQVICIANSEEILTEIKVEIDSQIDLLPRKDIAREALKSSKLILIKSPQLSIDFINEYAPEHFILCVEEPEFYLKNLINAGSVFIGNFTPESAGDYASGTNHTLPTNGFAKAYSGVNLDAFSKKITFQQISEEGLANIGSAIEIMAEGEGLQAHKNAVSIRMPFVQKNNAQAVSKPQTDLSRLVRKSVRTLKSYSSAREEYEGDAGILLDANENPFGEKYNRYPDPYQTELKNIIAARKGLSTNQIFLGNGSDDALDLLFRAFCEPGIDNVITTPPTFGMFRVLANLNDIKNVEIPLNPDFSFDPVRVTGAVNQQTKIIFLCSPSNPIGNEIPKVDIEKVLKNVSCLVVVDEAYIEFSETPSKISLLKKYPNLIITQTFSKAWGMAGIRLGICLAAPEIISVLNKIKMPYNISKLTQEAAINLLSDTKNFEEQRSIILSEKNKLKPQLEQLSFVKKVFPSAANFFLVRVENADAVYNYLINRGIVVRNRSKQLYCENCIRITVGTSTENQYLMEVLSKFSNQTFTAIQQPSL